MSTCHIDICTIPVIPYLHYMFSCFFYVSFTFFLFYFIDCDMLWFLPCDRRTFVSGFGQNDLNVNVNVNVYDLISITGGRGDLVELQLRRLPSQ